MRTVLAVLLGLLAATLVGPGGQAQFPSCGEMELVFRNPDLQPDDRDGKVHASGQFFIQFQAVGAQADDIAVFGFSFGPDTVAFEEAACDQPVWFTGAYVLNYRADRDPSDGFFIPIKTDIVPDGDYAAAVHAYDANGDELARFWARAVVDNCEGDAARCTDDLEQQAPHDTTAPWPIVLPGDGQPLEGHHLSVEFAEPVGNLTVHLNGDDITAEMEPWDGRIWDADSYPDYGPGGVGAIVAPPCTQPFHTCIRYGPAYSWNGRPLTDADIVRVEATDANGNRAIKDLHIASEGSGGAVTSEAPNLEITVDAVRKATAAGSSTIFRFDIQNTGGGTAHPFTAMDAPEGWSAAFLDHQPIPPGGRMTQELTVTPPSGTTAGTYDVNATISYVKAGREQSRAWTLEVDVQGGGTSRTDTATDDGRDEDSPALPLVLLLVASLAMAHWRR